MIKRIFSELLLIFFAVSIITILASVSYSRGKKDGLMIADRECE